MINLLQAMTFTNGPKMVLTAPQVDSVNRFDAADAVSPKPIKATARDARLMIKLPPNR